MSKISPVKSLATLPDQNQSQSKDHLLVLDDFKVLIEDEILLLKYEPDFQNIALAQEIRRCWESKRNVEFFNNWLAFKFATMTPSFVSLNEDANDNSAVNETLILRFFTLSMVILALQKSLEPMAEMVVDLKLEGEFSDRLKRLITAGVHLLYDQEIPNFICRLETKKSPDFISSWFADFQKRVLRFNEILKLTKLEDVLEEIYLLYEFMTDFLDYLDETEFEILEEEVREINISLSWILYLHGILYNLLLVIEKVFDSEEQLSNQELLPLKEILEEHDARLEMMRLLSNELTN